MNDLIRSTFYMYMYLRHACIAIDSDLIHLQHLDLSVSLHSTIPLLSCFARYNLGDLHARGNLGTL